jgi:hypothetical protein
MIRTSRTSLRTLRLFGVVAPHTANRADPIPPDSLTATADLAVRASLALMPFSAIAWLFIAR